MFTDDDFGRSLVWRVGVIHLVAVNEQDHVGILLDSARFAQVGHDRTFVRALLQRAVQLGQRDHGTTEFFRQAFQAPRNLGNLRGAVVARRIGRHQLQVIDDDQAQLAALARQTARAGAQFDRVQRRRFIDVQLRVVHLLDRIRQARPVFVVQAARAQAVLVQLPDGAEHTHGQLGAAHLHREHGHGQAAVDGHVFADVDGKRRLAHRRTARHDHQVARLQTGGHAVEVDETGGHARDFTLVVAAVQLVDAFDHLRQQRLDGGPALGAARAFFGDGENLRFGLVKHLLDFLALRAEGRAGDIVGDGDEFAQHAAVAHDLGITPDVRGRWRILRHGVQVSESAHIIGLAELGQGFKNSNDIGRPGAVNHLDDLLEDDAMVIAIEILRMHEVGDAVIRCIVAQQTTDNGLFCFDRMRRNTEGIQLRIRGGVHGANYTRFGVLAKIKG